MNNVWLPPPDLSIADWADKYRQISPEASAEPGQWKTDRAPYQREIMNAISDDLVEKVIVMSSAQVGKTEIILNTIGYYADKEPSPILVLQPTLEMGEAFSKDRLAPMIRDTSCLSGKIKDPRARDSGNTLLHKTFPGGHITITGANSPAGLASRPIRILLCDEIDRYPDSAGSEGDPVSLAVKRTQNFWNRKIVIVSTPTLKNHSRIEKEYKLSSQEVWELSCPECGEYNEIKFENIKYKGLAQPVLVCSHCGYEGGELAWKNNKGRWYSLNENIKNIRGFNLNAFASPWVSWQELINQYEEALHNGPENIKVYVNTVLGRPFEYSSEHADADELMARCEDYNCEVPEQVLVLTAGVDVQDDRLECEVLGWGLNKESWSIDYKVIYGDPGQGLTWQLLDEYLTREWHYASGQGIVISCTCIDSAGHFTDDVYKYCKSRVRNNIFAIVGRGAFGHPCVAGPSRTNRYHVPLFRLGVGTLKGILFQRLNIKKSGPGYCHFPKSEKYNELYFRGLLSEQMVGKRLRGREVIVWEVRDKNVRNEPLDCRVYAMGAFEIFNPDLNRHNNNNNNNQEIKTESRKIKKKNSLRIMRRGINI